MRSLLFICLGILSAVILSCSHSEESGRHRDARTLFEKSLEISMAYSDSLKMAKDSAEVERLSTAYEESINRLHFSYPPDLGLQISEGENDTLTSVTMRFVAKRDSLLKSFAHRRVETDSVSGD